MATLQTIGEAGGLPLLYKLPLELLRMIQSYTRHALLWRSIAALQVAARVSATDPASLVDMPLSEAPSWERGKKLEERSQPLPPPSALRLTIDSDGISKIERLSHLPEYSKECYTRTAFVVVQEAAVSGLTVQFKV